MITQENGWLIPDIDSNNTIIKISSITGFRKDNVIHLDKNFYQIFINDIVWGKYVHKKNMLRDFFLLKDILLSQNIRKEI